MTMMIKVTTELTAMPSVIALVIVARPLIHKSRNAEVKQICPLSIKMPKPAPNKAAVPSIVLPSA